MITDWRFNGLKWTGARKFVTVSVSFGGIVPKRVFGIQEGLVYRVTHCANARNVRKDHSVSCLVPVYQCRISNHCLLPIPSSPLLRNSSGYGSVRAGSYTLEAQT